MESTMMDIIEKNLEDPQETILLEEEEVGVTGEEEVTWTQASQGEEVLEVEEGVDRSRHDWGKNPVFPLVAESLQK